jgi:two-component system, sensor histidine kinase RpfC
MRFGMNKVAPIVAIRTFFVQFPDNEGEQAVMRMFLYPSLGFIYVYSLPSATNLDFRLIYMAIGMYFLVATGIFGALLLNPRRSLFRRLVGLFSDVVIVSALMIMMREYGIAFFGFYIWICQGYGFRHGRSFLRWAQSASMLGLIFVLGISEYWQAHLQIGVGLLFTMLYLPILASRLWGRERKALVAAENANRAKSRFLATVSHEIRTPLNSIIGLTDLLKYSRLSIEHSDCIRALSSSAEVLLSLVNNVLDIARIEAGKITIEPRHFILSELLANIINVLRNSAEAKGLSLSCDSTVSESDMLIGDADHLSQVFINLVANGIKFTQEGGVLIRVSEVFRSAKKVTLLCEIIDTGIGIPAERLNSIFNAFAQIHDSARSRYGGTGLGTTIAKELVELMGGKIGVKSEMQKGSTFWFKLDFGLPCRKQDFAIGRLLPETLSAEKNSPHDIQTPIRVLLVEDNVSSRMVATKILYSLGHTVCAVDVGEKALFCLACAKFDIVLLDMEMLGLSGLDILHRINQLGKNWRPHVFMLTANAISEVKAECEAAGASAFLTKPITIQRLKYALSTVPKLTMDCTPTILEGSVDHLRLIEQFTLGDNDFSYIFELEDGWCADYAETIQQLELALQECDNEKARYLLHNMEGGAREVGARHIAELCRSFLQKSTAANEVDLSTVIQELKSADNARKLVFELLKKMVFVDNLIPSLAETESWSAVRYNSAMP